MNADALLDRLDAEIGHAETKLAKLRMTRETLLELAGDATPVRAPAPPGGPPPAPAPEPQPVATPGKPQPPAKATPAAAPGAKRRPRGGLQDAVAAVLLRAPATRAEIANELGTSPSGLYEVLKPPFFEHTDASSIRSPYRLSAAGLARYAPERLPTTTLLPPPPVPAPPPQTPASVMEVKAQVQAIVAAMDRLGLTPNVEKIADEACLPAKVVHQRLLNNGPNALSPSMRYFRKSDSGLWGLTDRGRELLTTPA